MNTPIIDPSTLTEEQRNSIKIYYLNSIEDSLSSYMDISMIGTIRQDLLEELFGKIND